LLFAHLSLFFVIIAILTEKLISNILSVFLTIMVFFSILVAGLHQQNNQVDYYFHLSWSRNKIHLI